MDPILHLVTNKVRLRQDTAAGKVYLEKFENGAWVPKATFVDYATEQQEIFGDLLLEKNTPAVILSDTATGGVKLRIYNAGGDLIIQYWNGSDWVDKLRIDASTGSVELIGTIVQDIQLNKATPAVQLTGTENGAASVRIVESAGKCIIQHWNGTAWVDKLRIDAASGNVEVLGTITQDVRLNKATPALRLTGTETGAKDLSIRENAGKTEIYDNQAASVVMALEGHASRHASNGADPIPTGGLVKSQLAANTIQLEVPVPLGYIPTGLATDATGVKSESRQYLVSAELLACAKAAYFESDLQQLTGGTVNLELYDYTAAAVRASLTLSATSKRSRSANILASLVSGNPVGVRFNVTTAGAAGSLGGGCSPVLVLVLGVS